MNGKYKCYLYKQIRLYALHFVHILLTLICENQILKNNHYNRLSYWDWWLICLAMLSGGSHPAVEICNSLLFPIDAFGMHLPWTEIVKIRTQRFCTTILLENVPQLSIQLYILLTPRYSRILEGNSILYLTIASSVGSIAFSGLYFFVNQHKIKISKNR